MKKYLLPIVLASLLALAGCGLFFTANDPLVVTTKDNVIASTPKEEIIPAPIDLLPKDVAKQLTDSHKEVVLVSKKYVRDVTAPQVEIKPPTMPEEKTEMIYGIAEVGVDIAKIFLPGVGILEALGLLLSRRKRSHYAEFAKAITPYNGSVDIKEATLSLVRALGFAHSSEESKGAFESKATEVAVVTEPQPVRG